MAPLTVAFLGDAVSKAAGLPAGVGYLDRAAEALEQHGVLVMDWSEEEATAACWATERLDELQGRLAHAASAGELIVVIQLGISDRVYLLDMLDQALTMIVRVVQNANARPVVLQVCPDAIDRQVAEECGATLVHAPESLRHQFQAEPVHPFNPQGDSHAEIAAALLRVLESETGLSLVSHTEDHAMSKALRLVSGHRARSGGEAGPFDGVWMHKDAPNVVEVIQGDQIMSDDGNTTPIYVLTPDTFYIEHGDQRVEAQVVGNELRWSDGDLWCLVQDQETFSLEPPRRKKRGDLNSLKKAFQKLGEAVAVRTEEEAKGELAAERERLNGERQFVARERVKLEDAMHRLHEETVKLNELKATRGIH